MFSTKTTFFFVFFIVFLASCSSPPQTTTYNKLDRNKNPLIIAPMVEGASSIGICKQKKISALQKDPLYKICESNQFDLANSLRDKLNLFEPGGPHGKVQIGYTYGVSVLGLYEKTAKGWELSQERLQNIISTIKEVQRPVILYMMMNHFDTYSELAKELSLDNENLMLTENNTPPFDKYFNTTIIPFTLLTSEKIPVNRYRVNALRMLLTKLQNDQEAFHFVKGITLGGEVHQLFTNFKTGVGTFKDIQITDYSSGSIQQFQQWLQDKYQGITALNKHLDTDYTNWAQIDPPRKDIRKNTLRHYVEHLDSYANGIVPIFGWLWDTNKPNGKSSVNIYLDGNFIGYAIRDLNRLDVYQAIKEVPTANVGFRYELDFSHIKSGIHELLVTYSSSSKEYELTRQDIVFVDKSQSPPKRSIVQKNKFPLAKEVEHIRYWVDHPLPLQDFYFNPLAKDWFQFREIQVENFIINLWEISINSGIKKELLYSHQIPTSMNGSWNTVLFATNKTLQKTSPYQPGLTLYGGTTNSEALTVMFPVIEKRLYGIPEFHPQYYKNPQSAFDALFHHYLSNAKFITPYFISLKHEEINNHNEHQKFLINPENKEYGSNYLYNAILKISAL